MLEKFYVSLETTGARASTTTEKKAARRAARAALSQAALCRPPWRAGDVALGLAADALVMENDLRFDFQVAGQMDLAELLAQGLGDARGVQAEDDEQGL
jgi:hypothetical protein